MLKNSLALGLLTFALCAWAGDGDFKKGLKLLKEGHVEQARILFEDFISSSPSPEKIELVARAFAQFKYWGKSAQYYEQLTKQQPRNSAAWIELGLSRFEEGPKKSDIALDALKKAASLAPKDPRPYVLTANIYEKLGDRYEARVVYQDMLKAGVERAFAHSRLCYLFATEAYFDEALQNCRRAVELSPLDMNSLVTLGKALYDKGFKSEGFLQLAKATLRFKNEAMPFRVRGLLYLQEGNFTLARKDLGLAVGLDPSDGESAMGLGHALFESGLYEHALIAYTEGVHIDRKNLAELSRRQRMLSIKGDMGAYQKYSARMNSL